MMTHLSLTFALFCGVFAAPVVSEETKPGDLPVVVLIGDSIRMGYAPTVIERLEGKARVVSPERNGGDTSNVLKNIDEWAVENDPVVVHINAGLHDLKLDPESSSYQVSLEDYKANLETILDRLESKTNARLIFATTTPVLDDRHNKVKPFQRREADVQRYNATAREVLKSHPEILLHDLHAAALEMGIETALVADGVHFTPAASVVLGNRVADQIERALVEHLSTKANNK